MIQLPSVGGGCVKHGEIIKADNAGIYSENNSERWNAIEKLKGTIEYGECMFCNKERGMHFSHGFFFCKDCHDFVPEEMYYQWYAGFDVYMS